MENFESLTEWYLKFSWPILFIPQYVIIKDIVFIHV